MFLNNNTYDILIVIDFNMKPIKRKKGSAIFIHIAKKKLSPTKGCIAITKMNMRKIISKINKRSKITIY
jgi:L,D-peptidoglycan transpeptidase YkuD (ErfK/YbiS/YcfS/YnhG family)